MVSTYTSVMIDQITNVMIEIGELMFILAVFILIIAVPFYIFTFIYCKTHKNSVEYKEFWWWDKNENMKYFK